MRLLQTINLVLLFHFATGEDCLSVLKLYPSELVIKYGDPVSVNCISLSNHNELNWILPPEYVFNLDNQTVTWKMDSLTDWELEPQCYINVDDFKCNKSLPLTIYKPPDMVSISMGDYTGPVFEGTQYELQCDVQNVAPVHLLTVNWYKDQTLVESKNVSSFSKTPANQTFRLRIFPKEADNGTWYTCEAELNLRPVGLNHTPTVRSELPLLIKGSVSIKAVNHTGPMNTHLQYELQCDVQSVFPAQLLTVNWYKEEHFVKRINVSDSSKTTLNQIFTLLINSQKEDNGTWYMCEAVLNLGPDPPLTIRSNLYSITVVDVCPINVQPPKAAVEFGTSFSANCSVDLPHKGIGWEASQAPVEKTQAQLVTWNVENLTEWSIKPICYINLYRQCQVQLNMTVYKLPDRVILSTNITGAIKVGNQQRLQCLVQNITPVQLFQVRWYKNEMIVRNKTFSEPSKYPETRTTFYKPNPSNSDGEVKYYCEAVLNLGPEEPKLPPLRSNPLTFQVHYKPVINCFNWSPMVNTTLESYPYEVTGKPPPTITWFQGVNTSKPLGKKDYEYKYFATNKEGNASCVTKITVQYGPTIDCPSNFEAKEQDVLHNCTVMAFPEANVTWYKNGKIVNMPNNLTREDNGLYKITAFNKHGYADHLLNISVFYGPTIKPGQTLVVVKKGDFLSLECTADGNPAPNISWSFQNQTLENLQTTLAMTGDYTCTATNQFGSDTRTITQMVADRPSISSTGHNKSMIEHGQYSLQCEVHNVPSDNFLSVKWHKEKASVTTVNQSSQPLRKWPARLQFSANRTDNGAQYWCEVELKPIQGGRHSNSTLRSDPFNLTVLYSPKIKPYNTSTLQVRKGEQVTLDCKADGNPKPDVKWSFNNQSFKQKEVKILRATLADEGEYTCTASNDLGSDKTTVSLKVQETNWKYIIIIIIVILLILIILIIIVCWCFHKKRSGKYDICPNDPIVMKTLNNGTSE